MCRHVHILPTVSWFPLLLSTLSATGCPPCLCDRGKPAHGSVRMEVIPVIDGDTFVFDPADQPRWDGWVYDDRWEDL